MRDTKHQYAPAGLDIDHAEQAASILQERLSALIDLSLILKHVHWNVVGPGFMSMHKLMDEQTMVVRDLVDEVAERIGTLGGIAAGLAGQVTEMRDAGHDYALGRAPVLAHLGALDKVYERVTSSHRKAIEEVGAIDPISEDLLIAQSAKLELNHWFIRAHLENVDGQLSTSDATSELDAAQAAVSSPDSIEIEVQGLEEQPA